MPSLSEQPISSEAASSGWGLVFSGGGFGASYGLGVLQALKENYGLPKPRVIVGSSGSAPTACLYSTNQIEKAIDVWVNEISDPLILTKVNGRQVPRVDVERIIQSVRNNLDLEALKKDDTEVCFVATELSSGQPRILNAKEAQSAEEFYEMMRASMHLPGTFGRTGPVTIEDNSYVDGDISSSSAHKVEYVRSRGVEDIIVVQSTRLDMGRELMRILKSSPDPTIHNILRQNYRKLLEVGPSVTISPSKRGPCGLLKSNRAEDIWSTIHLGRQDALHHEGLKTLATRLVI